LGVDLVDYFSPQFEPRLFKSFLIYIIPSKIGTTILFLYNIYIMPFDINNDTRFYLANGTLSEPRPYVPPPRYNPPPSPPSSPTSVTSIKGGKRKTNKRKLTKKRKSKSKTMKKKKKNRRV